MSYAPRSSLLKMINPVSADRIIEKFPGPYKIDCTPYHKVDFSESTLKICAENNNITSTLLKICKIIIIGDISVGKTCIVKRFCHKLFDTNYKSTIGVDFEVERFDILKVGYNLQIWDTAGQERFKCIAQSYYRGSHVIILAFDFTNLSTLSNCQSWLNEALNTNPNAVPYIFLVGSKKDLLSKFAFKNAELSAIKVAKALNAEYWPVSSKTGQNIDKLFIRIASLCFDASIRNEIDTEDKKELAIGSDLISFKKNSMSEKSANKCQQFKCKTN